MPKKIARFTIAEQNITDVTVRNEYSMYHGCDPDDLTAEDFAKILKGEDILVSISAEDHPDFTALRDTLERDGYIKTQRGWWNGDTVLHSFYLNQWRFRQGDRFPCAGALRGSIKYAKQNRRKNLCLL